jgi:hypothetical protein
MKEGDVELASAPGIEIAPEETKIFSFEWTPTMEGETFIYGEVLLEGDLVIANNKTNNYVIDVQAEDISIITIEDGAEILQVPLTLYFRRSLGQTIYYPEEIGTNCLINTIKYNVNRTTATGNVAAVPITIWMGETNQQNFATTTSWVDPATLTQVYSGIHDFSAAGQYDLTIDLDHPFYYSATGNLVVYVYRADAGYGQASDGFFGNILPGSGRSIRRYTDGENINPMNPATGGGPGTYFEIIHGYPNIQLLIFDRLGALSGTVKDENNLPIEGARIQLVGYTHNTFTDMNGNYSFPYLQAGTFNIEVSYPEYVSQTISITIEMGETTTQNVQLFPRQKYSVSGKVTGNDAPDGILGAKITLEGESSYGPVFTNATGDYSIPDVNEGSPYTITVSKLGYTTVIDQVTVIDESVIKNIPMTEKLYPVSNVTAVRNGDNVDITWLAPEPFEGKTYTLDGGVTNNGWRINANTAGSLGNKFSVGESGELTSIDLYGRTSTDGGGTRTVTIDIYNEARELVGSSAPFVIPSGDWVNVPLNNIPYSETFYAMVHWPSTATETHFLGCDETCPNINENLDWYRNASGTWSLFHITAGSAGAVPAVWMIRANVNSFGKSASYGYNASIDNSKSLQGYEIYRLLQGQSEPWTLLTPSPTGTSYTDDITSLPYNVYQWAVKAKYSGGILSPAELSNSITLAASTYTVTVSSNNTNWGTTTGGGVFTEGENATVAATANTGYHFVNWTEGGVAIPDAGEAYTFTVTEDRTLVANFEINTYTVNVSANNGGTATVSGTGVFEHGQSATVTATANTGYHFVNWTEGGVAIPDAGETYTFTVTGDRTLVANFDANTYTVSISSNNTEWGTVEGGGTFTHGEPTTVKAIPTAIGLFIDWTREGASVSDALEYTFNVTEDVTLVANFDKEKGISNIGVATFTIYPNPAKELLTIARSTSNKAQVEIYNSIGLLVKQFEVNDTKTEVSVSSLSTGVYMMRIIDNGKNITHQVSTQLFVIE